MRTFTVWVTVEEHDTKTDAYQDVALDFSSTVEFRSQRKAEAFAKRLNVIGEALANHEEAK